MPADLHPNRAFKLAVALNVAIVVFEALYGFLSHSISLISESAHNLTDVLGLLLAWGANVLAMRRPTKRRTYGFRRTTILASLFNALILMLTTGVIFWEAVRRLFSPVAIQGTTVAWVAGTAIVFNGISAWLFARGRKGDINVRGAFLHMLSDAVISAGVVAAGLLVYWTGLLWIDPALSIVISTIITVSTWKLLKESFDLASDAVPSAVDIQQVESYLCSVPGVVEVHDLHIWGMSSTQAVLTVHLVLKAPNTVLVPEVTHELHERFGVDHVTIQTEYSDGPACTLAPEHIV